MGRLGFLIGEKRGEETEISMKTRCTNWVDQSPFLQIMASLLAMYRIHFQYVDSYGESGGSSIWFLYYQMEFQQKIRAGSCLALRLQSDWMDRNASQWIQMESGGRNGSQGTVKKGVAKSYAVSYTHLTLPTNREV